MRIYFNLLFLTAAFLFTNSGLMLASAPAAAQEDILLPPPETPVEAVAPAADMPVAAELPADTPPVTAEPADPSTLLAPVDPSQASAAEEAMDNLLKKIDDGAQTIQPASSAVPSITPEVVLDNTATPAETSLSEPTLTSKDVADVPAVPPASIPDENLFFDADTLVPTGAIGASGPRKVNPVLEPASKLIVVKKDYSPTSREAQFVAAERAIKLGHYDAALELYNGLYVKNKRDPNILMGRAIALQHLKQDAEAIQAYEELLDLRPNDIQAQVNMLGLMGQTYPAVSLQRLSDLHASDPNNISIVGQMAVLQANMGQYEDAFKYLGIAASMEPHNANHLFNMAVIADRAGKTEQAVNYYEQALEIDSVYNGGSSIPRDAVYERLARLR